MGGESIMWWNYPWIMLVAFDDTLQRFSELRRQVQPDFGTAPDQ